MSAWDRIYENGSIHTNPSKEIIALVPYLRKNGVSNILDVGCGTGRHSIYLFKEGFNVKGIDISKKAIEIARNQSNELPINYEAVDFENIQLKKDSFDFV
jgi:2-polyprenyl-3-methyl-5-hydroxy-6-metoxy-1,4-benzoquinol methylase